MGALMDYAPKSWAQKYKPNPMRPAYLVNKAGGVISWDKWLKRTASDAGVDIAAMVFDDGHFVMPDGSAGTLDLRSRFASHDMRCLADG